MNLLDVNCPRTDVKSEFFLTYGISGESYIFEGERFPAEPAYYANGVRFAEIAGRLWEEGKWKTHPYSVFQNGLYGVLDGMQKMREGKGPSGEKWVYRIEDTKWPSAG